MGLADLSDEQREAFDTEYVNPFRWKLLQPLLADDFADRPFRVIDVGGGNGVFADRLLSHYPRAEVTVLEPGQNLLDRNSAHPRKSLVAGSFADLGALEPADLIAVHWVLHHLVAGTYRRSASAALAAMVSVRSALRDGRSRCSVFENDCNGATFPSVPGRAMYAATKSRVLSPIARRAGANTAGVGVCFRSHEQWRATFTRAGFAVEVATESDARAPGLFARSALARRAIGLASWRTGHYWLAPQLHGS